MNKPTGWRVGVTLAVLLGSVGAYWWRGHEALKKSPTAPPNPTISDVLWNGLKLAAGVGVPDPNYWLIDFLVVGVVVVAVVAGVRRLPLPYLTYALGSLLIPLSYPFTPRPLLSMPRFVAVIFPAFWVLADAAERRRLPHTAIIATFAGGLSLLAVLFMNWWHIF